MQSDHHFYNFFFSSPHHFSSSLFPLIPSCTNYHLFSSHLLFSIFFLYHHLLSLALSCLPSHLQSTSLLFFIFCPHSSPPTSSSSINLDASFSCSHISGHHLCVLIFQSSSPPEEGISPANKTLPPHLLLPPRERRRKNRRRTGKSN